MRALVVLFLASPAAAWEASSVGQVCLLTHQTDEVDVTVSHDPGRQLPYAIDLTRTTAWQAGPVFAIRFDGPGGRTISTDRHQMSEGATRLVVTDSGFGNVLDGIALNDVAVAFTGETAVIIPLAGAAPEVEKFRDCASAPSV